MSKSNQSKRAVWDARIVRRAAWDSVIKLNPRTMMRNPVMFVVEVGSVVTTALLFYAPRESFAFNLQITLWLWFTVLFANFAEAMAEGRGKAQADTLRKARSETQANRLLASGQTEVVPSSQLRTAYGRFNQRLGIGGQILWRPNGWLSILGNQYALGPPALGNPGRIRYHTDDSIEIKYYDHPGNWLDKAAFSLTGDAGCKHGRGVSCWGNSAKGPKQSFLGYMVYNRLWFLVRI